MSTPVDHAVRERITTTGLAETLFVDAGAGTGKTSTLVDRIVHLVLHEQVALSDIAAITFSEAAAAELRDRVRRALDTGAASVDSIVAERCRSALAEFDTAAISTLHGFAHRLLRDHPIDVAIPPRVEVLDEVQSILAFEDRWNACVDQWQQDEQFVPLVVRLWSIGVELRRAFGPSLKDVASVLDDNWDRLEAYTPQPRRAPAPLDRAPLLAAIDDALALSGACADPADTLLARIASFVPEWRALSDPDLDDDQFLALLRARTKWSHARKGTKKAWDDIDAARACVAAVEDAAGALFAQAVDDVLTIWLGVLHGVTLDAAHARRDAGRLEFHDLLVLARRLLRTSSAARRAVHQRYTRVLLDEFQDTDPIQIELAMRIAADPAQDAADWRELAPPPGRLFFVGDPKQSIYRFRRADIALFHEARDAVGVDAQVSLVQNFRTVAPILDWVNAVFDVLMPVETPSQPRYRALSPMRVASAAADHRVVLFGAAAHADDPPAAELRRREAAEVAAIIDGIRADPAGRPVCERAADGTDAWRPARCADITVLIPSRTSLPMLEAALVAADVPYRVDTSTLVFDAPEIRELLAVLTAVDDPADAVAVVAALRSPVLGCSDPELFDWVAAGGSFDYRSSGTAADPAGGGAPLGGAVAEAMAALAAWHDEARWCEPATLLERIVRERDVYALALADRRPRDVWRRVRFLIDQARQFADVGGGHLRDFVRWADLQRHEGARVPEPLLPETDDDAVRIMTFHGAKGLEFPIVILSGLTTRPGGARSGPQVNWHADGRPEVSLGAGKATTHFEVLNEFESEMDVDEKLRLLYVGATRARDHLFVSTHRRAKDHGTDTTYASRVQRVSAAHAEERFVEAPPLAGALTRAPDAPVPDAPAPDAPAPETSLQPVPVRIRARRVPVPAPDQLALFGEALLEEHPLVREHRTWAAARDRLLTAQARVRPVWSPTAIAAALDERRAPPPAVAVLAPGEADEVDGGPLGEPGGRGGTAFGRAVHQVLQHATPSDELTMLATRAAHEELHDPARAPEVAAAAAHVLASPTVAAAFASGRVWRELPVCAVIGAPEPAGSRGEPPAGALIEGFVDLLAEVDGALVLVDYKTDRVDPGAVDAHVARYAPQLATYALAIEAAVGRPVDRAVLVFTTATGAHERSVPAFGAAKAEVIAFLHGTGDA